MAENSKIQWTDHTFNPWRGCQKVSPGCKNCYADTLSKRNPGTLGIWGSDASGATRVVASESMWREPIKWDKAAAQAGVRHRVFCASLGDVFESWPDDAPMCDHKGAAYFKCGCRKWLGVGAKPCNVCSEDDCTLVTMNDVRRRLFMLIEATPNLDWLLLTKRPENIREMWVSRFGAADVPDNMDKDPNYRSNVWLGTSVENQDQADKRIPQLVSCRDLSPVLCLSCEPLLGPVRLDRLDNGGGEEYNALTAEVIQPWHQHKFRASDRAPINWVIAGGESGPGARPCNIDWIRSLKHQCESASVPFFCKQLGSVPLDNLSPLPGAAIKDKKGGDIDEWPQDLRVRQVPEVG